MLVRQEDKDRWERQEKDNLAGIVENEVGEEEDREDDEGAGDERDIWEVAHVTEEDFEATEGKSEDLYDKLMEMTGWKVTDKEKENVFSEWLDLSLVGNVTLVFLFVFLIKVGDPITYVFPTVKNMSK